MKKLGVAFVLMVSMSACKKGTDDTTAGSGSSFAVGSATAGSAMAGSASGSAATATSDTDPKAVVAKVASFKDAMCGCKDKACADRVNDEYVTWGTEMSTKMMSAANTPKPDDATMKQMTEAAMAYGECMTKAMSAGAETRSGSAAIAADDNGPGGDPLVKEGLAKMSEYADKMCACKDVACTDRIGNELTAWGEEMAKKAVTVPKPSTDEQKKMQDLAMKYGECMMKVAK